MLVSPSFLAVAEEVCSLPTPIAADRLKSDKLIEAALARGLGRSPAEGVERAFDSIAREVPMLSAEELGCRHQAVDAMLAFGAKRYLPTSGFRTHTKV
jgi:hypothetical protein